MCSSLYIFIWLRIHNTSICVIIFIIMIIYTIIITAIIFISTNVDLRFTTEYLPCYGNINGQNTVLERPSSQMSYLDHFLKETGGNSSSTTHTTNSTLATNMVRKKDSIICKNFTINIFLSFFS